MEENVAGERTEGLAERRISKHSKFMKALLMSGYLATIECGVKY